MRMASQEGHISEMMTDGDKTVGNWPLPSWLARNQSLARPLMMLTMMVVVVCGLDDYMLSPRELMMVLVGRARRHCHTRLTRTTGATAWFSEQCQPVQFKLEHMCVWSALRLYGQLGVKEQGVSLMIWLMSEWGNWDKRLCWSDNIEVRMLRSWIFWNTSFGKEKLKQNSGPNISSV